MAGRMGISVAKGQGFPNPLAAQDLAPWHSPEERQDPGMTEAEFLPPGRMRTQIYRNETCYTSEFVTRESHWPQI